MRVCPARSGNVGVAADDLVRRFKHPLLAPAVKAKSSVGINDVSDFQLVAPLPVNEAAGRVPDDPIAGELVRDDLSLKPAEDRLRVILL